MLSSVERIRFVHLQTCSLLLVTRHVLFQLTHILCWRHFLLWRRLLHFQCPSNGLHSYFRPSLRFNFLFTTRPPWSTSVLNRNTLPITHDTELTGLSTRGFQRKQSDSKGSATLANLLSEMMKSRGGETTKPREFYYPPSGDYSGAFQNRWLEPVLVARARLWSPGDHKSEGSWLPSPELATGRLANNLYQHEFCIKLHQYSNFGTTYRPRPLSKFEEPGTKSKVIALANHRNKRILKPSYEEVAPIILVQVCPDYGFGFKSLPLTTVTESSSSMASDESTEEVPIHDATGELNLPPMSRGSSKSGLTYSLTIKLDEKNFLLWIQQVNGVITVHNLHWFVVNPEILLQYATVADRLDGKNSEEYKTWLFKDQSLFTWLLSSILDGVLPRVLKCKHSHEVWEKIHKYFNSVLKSRARQLRFELKNTKKSARSVSEYLLRIKSIVNSLIAMGDMSKYGSEYYNVAARRGKGRGKGRGRGRGRAQTVPTGGKIQCQICVKPNHEAIDCWYRYDPPSARHNNRGYSKGPPSRPPHFNPYPCPTAHLAIPQYYSSIPDMDNMSNASWYPDSGASHHLTYNSNNLGYRTLKFWRSPDGVPDGAASASTQFPAEHNGQLNNKKQKLK
ncbi:hypothetical protein TSUD_135840 [Trifolium subterraneum]|uniref:Retrotransposon Copia-like N-terminal domain-containing protein n=1 Tax=Trifolium subterraneum TaxID=3900 RepID=A0A2Z6NJJ8_TRISU|nr:hypothetical protein TSUD_135840 [Trifolium subterraneum]